MPDPHPPSRLAPTDFALPAADLARRLLGVIIQRTVAGIPRRARLVEVEAYLGPSDLASHSSKGRTARTDVMFGPPGHAYVYFVYGMHYMLNIVAGVTGEAHAVLLRGAEPLDGWPANLIGPGRLAKAFAITMADNRMDLCGGDIALFSDPTYRPIIQRRKRIGIDYAGRWKNRLLRFVDISNPVARRIR